MYGFFYCVLGFEIIILMCLFFCRLLLDVFGISGFVFLYLSVLKWLVEREKWFVK